MIDSLYDFQFEQTLLQHMAGKMGRGLANVSVERTPICHAELAGEGIEYTWGYAKLIYRRLPLSMKKTRALFEASVKGCLSGEKLTKERIRKFAQRARRYIFSYYVV